MTTTVEIEQICDLSGALGQRWLAECDRHQFAPQYHPVWLAVLRELGEDCTALVAVTGNQIAGWLMYTVSESSLGIVFNSLPFLPYGGPVADDPQVESQLLTALRALAIESNADVVSIATHPMLSTEAEDRWRTSIVATFQYENFVQLQSTDRHPLEAMKSRTRNAFQRKIRRATDAGISVQRADRADQIVAWLSIYRNRFREIDARPYPDAFFRQTFELAASRGVTELWLAVLGSKIVGGTWLLVGPQCVDYFASAFDSEFDDRYPATLVMDRIFSYLVERRSPVLNWQSSPGRGGVYEFKRRWGAGEHRHLYLSAVRPESPLLQASQESLSRVSHSGSSFPTRHYLRHREHL